MKTGRPSKFSEEMGLRVCEEVAAGRSLRSVCADKGMPCMTSVLKYLAANDAFALQYARAKETQMTAMAEEILEISDDSTRDTYINEDGQEVTNHEVVQRARLRVDTRKWLMSKLAPKKYGDRLEVDHTGQVGLIGRIPSDEEWAEEAGGDAKPVLVIDNSG